MKYQVYGVVMEEKYYEKKRVNIISMIEPMSIDMESFDPDTHRYDCGSHYLVPYEIYPEFKFKEYELVCVKESNNDILINRKISYGGEEYNITKSVYNLDLDCCEIYTDIITRETEIDEDKKSEYRKKISLYQDKVFKINEELRVKRQAELEVKEPEKEVIKKDIISLLGEKVLNFFKGNN